ncbi:MAG: hypothetical protein GY827_11710 [Cytophagales bacterium]|nr:hypothetical protein [Cytophagales bacterium]
MNQLYKIITKFGLYVILGVTVTVLAIAGITYDPEDSSSVDMLLDLAYVLVYGAVATAVLLPLIGAVKNPKSLVRPGIVVVTLLGIFGACYKAASSEVLELYQRLDNPPTPDMVQLSGGLIQTTLILIVLAVAGVVLGEISKVVR